MRRGLFAIGLIAVAAVCIYYFIDWSRKKPKALVPASGKILQADGTPAVAADVRFWPKENPKAFVQTYRYLPFAITNVKGEFELVLDPSQPMGVPPGKYAVTVSEIDARNKNQIPEEYEKPSTTPWELTIPAEGKTDILLKIERK